MKNEKKKKINNILTNNIKIIKKKITKIKILI